MGLYERADSPKWWMYLEGGKGIRGKHCSTGVPIDAATPEKRKEQRTSALAIYNAAMTDRARVRHDLPPLLDHPTVTFAKFSPWYEKTIIPRHRGAERELVALNILRAFFGRLELHAITSAVVSDYEHARLAAGVKPGTVNRETTLLKSILIAAVGAKHLKASPLVGRKKLREIKIKKRYLSPQDELRLLQHLKPADRALFVVSIDTLMRMGNVLNLKRAEDKGTYLSLHDSKTGPYDPSLSSRARKALDSLPNDGPYFFTHRRRAKSDAARRAGISKMMRAACAKCVPPIPFGRELAGGVLTFHIATRATGATRMIRAKIDPKTIQAIGNWSSFHQMGEYLQADELGVRNAAVETIAPVGTAPTFTQAPKLQSKSGGRGRASSTGGINERKRGVNGRRRYQRFIA